MLTLLAMIAGTVSVADIGGDTKCLEHVSWSTPGCILRSQKELAGSLIGAAGTIFAGWLASLGLQKQIVYARQQANIALGDIPPVTWLKQEEIAGRNDARCLRLTIANHNRRLLRLTKTEVIRPTTSTLQVERFIKDGQGKHLGHGGVTPFQEFNEVVDGARPSAPEASRMSLLFSIFTASAGAMSADGPLPAEVCVRIHYDLVGAGGS